MPSTATVTSFFTFVAGTKAKASEVNTDFSTFRGHIVPVNTDTTTSSNNTHDLGATDHQWRRLYLQEPPLVGGVRLNRVPIPDVYDGSTPPDLVAPVNDLDRIGFPFDTDRDVRFQFVVPPEYVVGQRIALTIKGYPDTTGAFVFHTLSRMYRMSVTAANSNPSAALTGTATITPASANLYFENSSLKLTDASGLINGVTVTVGEVITVSLARKATDAGDVSSATVYLTDMLVDLNK